MLILGAGLLLVGLIAGVISTSAVKNFSDGYDVKAGRTYYLLANEDSLEASTCQLVDSAGLSIGSSLESAEPSFDPDNPELTDVSLPFAEGKGVFSTITFNEDVSGARYICEQGTNYISAFSPGTLQALRYLTLLTAVFGLGVLTLTVVLRPGRGKANGR